jgi:peptide/nickel transport system substrate-binding protein
MRMKIALVRAVAVFGAVAFCLAGCGQKTVSPENTKNSATNYPLPDPPVVVNCTPGIRGGKFIISEAGEPKTFNYITANESSSIDICRFMFWNLLNYDEPKQVVEPGLAEFWTNTPDGKTWTFRLRKNLRWSDGAPLTADDVVFTWNDVIYNPQINNVTRDGFILNGKKFTITKVDDLTIQVVTPVVYAPFLAEFGAGVPIMPKHILEKSVADGTFATAYGVNWNPTNVVGSGPYRLKEYKQAQYTVLERNPYFIEVDTNGTRLPYFDDIIFTVVPDFDAMALSFLSGECDVDDQVYPYQYDQFKAGAGQGKFTLLDPGVGLETSFFWFNQDTETNALTGQAYVDPVKLKWFRDTKFRQAVSYAINRDAIIQSVFSGRAVPATGMETTGDPKWYDPDIKAYPYDPAKALELLKEIGIEKRNGNSYLTDSNGNKIAFVFNTNVENDARKKMAVFIQADLNKLGMDVIFQPVQFNELVTKIDDTHNYDCILMGLAPGSVADPAASMNVFKSDGFTHFWFPREKTPSTPWEARINQLMDDQVQTLDMAKRKKDYDEAQEIMQEQQPFIFTTTPIYYAAIHSGTGNVRPTVFGGYRATWNVEELYYKK